MKINKRYWLNLILILIVPILALVLGIYLTITINFNPQAVGSLVANLIFLAATLTLIMLYKATDQDVGLKIIKNKIVWHILTALAVFALYLFFYIFAIRITGLQPFTSETAWGILAVFITVLTEELYFRGFLYRFLELRFPSWLVVILTALFFAIFNFRQGYIGMLYRSTAGFLWGTIRYSSEMIFLIIFPIHFFYNAMWFLFMGTFWSNPPIWAVYGQPVAEVLLGVAIFLLTWWRKRRAIAAAN